MEVLNDLNEKQVLFCLEYLKDFNGTQAAIRAGYSEKSAYSQAHDLLIKPEIKQYIEDSSRAIFNSSGINVERILAEITSIAFSEKAANKDRLKALYLLLKYHELKAVKDISKEDQNIKIEFISTKQKCGCPCTCD